MNIFLISILTNIPYKEYEYLFGYKIKDYYSIFATPDYYIKYHNLDSFVLKENVMFKDFENIYVFPEIERIVFIKEFSEFLDSGYVSNGWNLYILDTDLKIKDFFRIENIKKYEYILPESVIVNAIETEKEKMENNILNDKILFYVKVWEKNEIKKKEYWINKNGIFVEKEDTLIIGLRVSDGEIFECDSISNIESDTLRFYINLPETNIYQKIFIFEKFRKNFKKIGKFSNFLTFSSSPIIKNRSDLNKVTNYSVSFFDSISLFPSVIHFNKYLENDKIKLPDKELKILMKIAKEFSDSLKTKLDIPFWDSENFTGNFIYRLNENNIVNASLITLLKIKPPRNYSSNEDYRMYMNLGVDCSINDLKYVFFKDIDTRLNLYFKCREKGIFWEDLKNSTPYAPWKTISILDFKEYNIEEPKVDPNKPVIMFYSHFKDEDSLKVWVSFYFIDDKGNLVRFEKSRKSFKDSSTGKYIPTDWNIKINEI